MLLPTQVLVVGGWGIVAVVDENRFEAAAREAGLLDPRCIGCDYNLRDNMAGRCPECGLEFDPAKLVPLAVPWMYRRQIGYVQAYWRTLWFMVRRSAKLRYWTNYPLDAADVWAFARWTRWILFAMAAAVTATLVLLLHRMWPHLSARDASRPAHLLPLWKDPALYVAIWWWMRPGILLAILWAVLGVCVRLGALTTTRSDPDRERNAVLRTYEYCSIAVLLSATGFLSFWVAIAMAACSVIPIYALPCWVAMIVVIVAMGCERTGKDLRNRRNIPEAVYMAAALLLLGGLVVLLTIVTFLAGDVIESLMW